MALLKPVVFPLLPIVWTENGPKCACGNENCGRIGKHPAVAWGEIDADTPVPPPAPGAGLGIKTGARPRGSGIVVVDLDTAEASLRFDELGGAPDPTHTVATGRGWQLAFEDPGFPVRNSAGALGPGIDIRGEGGFVVSPGSPHKSGVTYEIIDDAPPAHLPSWLREWLQSRVLPIAPSAHVEDIPEGPERERRRGLYAAYLREDAPARGPERRGKGDATLFEVVQYGAYDLRLPTEDVFELVREHYDPRCSPPWGDELPERVRHKANDAKTRSMRPRIEPLTAQEAALLAPKPIMEIPTTRKKRPDNELIWGQWDVALEPPKYLVDQLIPMETVGMFVAMGSSLKTWCALDIARCIARGEPWLGRYLTRPGRVLFLDFESGLYELRRRMRLLDRGATSTTALGAWSYPPGQRIDDPQLWLALSAHAVPEAGGLALVVIDSLAAGAPGTDENDARADAALQLGARFTEATGAGVLVIHHARKDDGGDERKIVRGSTALFAACDWIYKFENVEETPEYRRMTMSCIKPCMGPKPAPVRLQLANDTGLTWFEDEGRIKLEGGGISDEDIDTAIELALDTRALGSMKDIAKALGRDEKRVTDRVRSLEGKGRVLKAPSLGGYVLNTPERQRSRVLVALDDQDRWSSTRLLAHKACVRPEVVESMISGGEIVRSAEGRYWRPKV